MNIDPSIAARIRNAFTPEAYTALHDLCEQRVKARLNDLVSAKEESETWHLRGEINTLRLFSTLEESAKNLSQNQQ